MKNNPEELKRELSSVIHKNAEKLIEIARKIHQNPEICYQEYLAVETLLQELKKHGFTIEVKTAGIETAFRAYVKSKREGPQIAILAEYDALPEIGHACGHNIIGTAALGAVIAMKSIIAKTGGTVWIIGTPAEEGGGGKILMAEKGAFEGMDVAMMIHPFNKTLPFLPSLSVQQVELIFEGRAAHAAISPETGINALDAVVQTYNSINSLRQQLPDDVRIHGIITDGGMAVNVIPERAAVKYGVRTREQSMLESLMQKIINCAKGAALATGTTITVKKDDYVYEAFRMNTPLVDAVQKNLETLNITADPPVTASGGLGSLDMGNVSQIIPSVHVYLAICDESTELHTPEFREAANSEEGYDMLIRAAELMAYTACDLLTDATLLRRMKEDFDKKP